jgi:hypothetical protein
MQIEFIIVHFRLMQANQTTDVADQNCCTFYIYT